MKLEKVENVNLDGMVMGRAASMIAQKILMGYTINAYNVEKVIITGRETVLLDRYTERVNYAGKGDPTKGPKYSRMPQNIFRKTVKNMLPNDRTRGTEALKKLRVYIGNSENVKLIEYDAKAKGSRRYTELGEICKKLGAKW